MELIPEPIEVVDHLSEWMKIQEEANKEIARMLLHIDGRLKGLEARVYDLEHSHHYIIQELRALIKPTAEPTAAPGEGREGR